MNTKRYIMLLVLGAFAAGTAPVRATDFTWLGGTPSDPNAWTTNTNWNPTGVPGGGDTATVPVTANHPQLSKNVAVAALVIQAAAQVSTHGKKLAVTGLDVNLGGTLLVDGPGGTVKLNGPGIQIIDGRIRLVSNSAVLQLATSCRLVGCGRINGENASAKIAIPRAVTVTSRITVSGRLKITKSGASAGVFINDGVVVADDPFGTLVCQQGTFRGCGHYKVTATGATLEFGANAVATNLTAHFDVEAGTLNVDTDVITSRHLRFTGGVIAVASGKVFIAN